MSDADLLASATRALREATPATNEGMAEMLVRIEQGRPPLVARRRARMRVVAWTLAATLVGLGAFASGGGAFARFLHRTEEAPARGQAAPPRPALAPRRARNSESPAMSAARARPDEAPTADPLASALPRTAPTGARVPAPRDAVAASARSSAFPSPSSAAIVEDSELYRTAHRLHFVERDWSAALSAWELYLAAAGTHGSMVVEARYNRGLALARLGRTEDARRALAPFAAGEYGGYRREEARALIQSFDR